jgi:hypothetical protein
MPHHSARQMDCTDPVGLCSVRPRVRVMSVDARILAAAMLAAIVLILLIIGGR